MTSIVLGDGNIIDRRRQIPFARIFVHTTGAGEGEFDKTSTGLAIEKSSIADAG